MNKRGRQGVRTRRERRRTNEQGVSTISGAHEIRTKRVYEPADRADGLRILVDRVWPRGRTKEEVQADLWMKDVAPSTELRRWYGHDRARWDEFERRYFRELDGRSGDVAQILDAARRGPVTLLYSARDEQDNQAEALLDYLRSPKLAAVDRDLTASTHRPG